MSVVVIDGDSMWNKNYFKRIFEALVRSKRYDDKYRVIFIDAPNL